MAQPQGLIQTDVEIAADSASVRLCPRCSLLRGICPELLLRSVGQRVLEHFRFEQAGVSQADGKSGALKKTAIGEPILGARCLIAIGLIQAQGVLIKAESVTQFAG